jgi:uncharacterized protein
VWTPLRAFGWLLLVPLACRSATADTGRDPAETRTARPAKGRRPASPAEERKSTSPRQERIVLRAREEVARGVHYDPAYVRLSYEGETDTRRAVYPGGDLDPSRGVCTDVVIRALREVGVDLQKRLHEDILARPAAYPNVLRPDANIDHRRVGPLLTYFRAHAVAPDPEDFQPGDIVVYAFRPPPASTADHVGVVSDRLGPRGRPLVIHNIGPEPSEDDVLESWTMLGHFRL